MNKRNLCSIISVFLVMVMATAVLAKKEKNGPEKKSDIKKAEEKAPEASGNNGDVEKDAVETGTGESLYDTVKKGGPLMIFIIMLGLVSLTIILERIIFHIRTKSWKKETIEDYISDVASRSGAVYREQLDDELREAFQVYTNRIEKGMALLNGIGNLSPIVGFLGTVIGMISAFAAIAAATTVNAKVVAVGIQVALVTTAGGLTIAAPTLLAYHTFNHMLQNIYAYADEIIPRYAVKLPSMLKEEEKTEKTGGEW